MKARKLLLLLVFLFITPAFGQGLGNVTPLHDKAIRQMIKTQFTPAILDDLYLEVSTQIALEYWTAIQPILKRTILESEKQRLQNFWYKKTQELMPYSVIEDLLVPVVAKHLTYEEVLEINQFFATPTGKKFIALIPIISREAQVAGSKFVNKYADSKWVDSVDKELKILFPDWFPN